VLTLNAINDSIFATAVSLCIADADDLTKEPDLLTRFERDAEIIGLVGEKENAKIIFLVAASAGLPEPLQATVTANSSAGKNALIGTVAKFLPEERQKFLTGMSAKTLMYTGEDEYQHKAVFIAEHEGVAGADYAIRTMQSERVVEYEVVNSKTFKTEKKKVNGPVAFIEATTRTVLHPENETRLMFLRMDESEKQTRAILTRKAIEKARGRMDVDHVLAPGHKFFRTLTSNSVRIPFAEQLANDFPADKVRARRDFSKLLGLIEALAYVHQHHRKRDGEGNILATPQDYLYAKRIFEHCYREGPEKRVAELLEAVENRSKFSVAHVTRDLGWGQTVAYEIVNRALELGCIEHCDRRGRYKFVKRISTTSLELPSKIRLTAEQVRYLQ
jgi:hypothetical protein